MERINPVNLRTAEGRATELLDAVKAKLGIVPNMTRSMAVSPLVLEPGRTALVLTDLQNDFLNPGGKGWALFADSYARNGTVRNLERLLKASKAAGLPVLISPHYYYPTDKDWTAPGSATELLMAQLPVFQRQGPLTLDGFAGSGADFPEQYKPYILDAKTVILSPHKVYGSSTNDMILQLRKRRIEKVVMAGPAGNLCVEAHFRDLLEYGFEVAMVRDAIGGTSNEEGDGVQAALVNFRSLAHALWTTEEALDKFADLSRAARFNGVEPQRAEALTNSGSAS